MKKKDDKFAVPTRVTELDIALGFCCEMDKFLPPYNEIPEEFKDNGDSKWLKFQRDWFFRGISNLHATTRDGVDRSEALAHLAAIQRSFEPKHEHKEAAVAYLASRWFIDISYTTSDEKAAT